MASKVLTWIAAVAATVALWGAPDASAQQPFAAAATVDGTAITNYQVGQRALFYGLLRAPDADFEGALDRLIDETLQVREAEEAGVELSPEELDAGLEEFAQRAELSRDAFVAALAEAGVAFETYRDFVSNGLLIRRLVQQRFGERARPSDGEIEQALARGAGGGVRLLLSEIALPLNPETQTEVQALADQLSQTVSSQAEFERAARTYSRAASARAGGRLDWIPLGQLAPPIASQVLTLGPGEISEPVNLGSFIGLFLLRDLDESAATSPSSGIVDFAEYRIPGGRTPEALGRARALRARVDTCDDLFGIARGGPEGVLTRETQPLAALPADLRQELAKLDANEVSTLLTRQGFLRFVMLCDRIVEREEDAFLAQGQQLLGQRLAGFQQGFLEELRADAIITRN